MNDASPTDDSLRAEGERIEHLLNELSGMVGPEVWPRIHELTQRIVDLYGAALGRLLSHAQAGYVAGDLTARICSDELLSSLMLIHGLHPETTETRVRRALETLRPRMGRHGMEVVAAGDGALSLKSVPPCDGCGVSHATVERFVRTALEEVAPEITAIQIDGLAPERPAQGLVSLHVPARTGVAP